MNYYYVTGSSRGLGQAIVERLLKDPQNRVVGMARGEGIQHGGYEHRHLDLTDLAQVREFEFEERPGAGRIGLINNAGLLVVDEVGEADPQAIIDVSNINLVAPYLLTNAFVRAYRGAECQRVVLNIGSGAGRTAVPGVGTMCVTKSGLDMLSRVLAEEQKISGDGIRVCSISPGLVDTEMYAVGIRAADGSRPARGVMAGRLRSQQPAPAAAVAEKICRLLEEPDLAPDVIAGLQELP